MGSFCAEYSQIADKMMDKSKQNHKTERPLKVFDENLVFHEKTL